MRLQEILHPVDESELAMEQKVKSLRGKLTNALIGNPMCLGSDDDHEYEAMFDDTSLLEDGELFRVRVFMKSGSYSAVGVESVQGSRSLIFPRDSRHAIYTQMPLITVKSDGFPIDGRADISQLDRFETVVNLAIRAMKGDTAGTGYVQGKWLEQ